MYLAVLVRHERIGIYNLTPQHNYTEVLSCIFLTVPLYGIGMLIKTTVPKKFIEQIKKRVYRKINRKRELDQVDYSERDTLLST